VYLQCTSDTKQCSFPCSPKLTGSSTNLTVPNSAEFNTDVCDTPSCYAPARSAVAFANGLAFIVSAVLILVLVPRRYRG
jgi:hypothetical protein